MIKLKSIPLSMLHKLETKELVLNVISILERNNPETLRLDDFYTLLLKQNVKMSNLTIPYGKHVLTGELKKLHKKRLRIASYIAVQVSEMEKMDGDEKQMMAKTAKMFSKLYLTYLGRKNRDEVSIAIAIFFMSIRAKDNHDVYEAFIGMGLQTYLDDLDKTNKEYRQLYNERSHNIEKRPKTGDIFVEREAHSLLRYFFWKINYYQTIYKEIDYTPLINGLNVELTSFSKTIKTRIATNKRRAKKKAEAAAKLKKKNNSGKDKGDSEEDNPSRENS